MAQQPVAIQVEGLKDLQRALRRTPERLDKELRKANKKVVQEVLVPPTRAAAPKGPTGRLARSVGSLSTAQKARLKVGSNARVPYAGVINFGWPARNIEAQEFVYKTIVKERDQLMDVYIEFIDKAVQPAFPNGRL